MNLREQACWLALVFESRLSVRVVNSILAIWCKQLDRCLEDFFAASTQEWSHACHLGDTSIQKLEQAREKLVGQAFLVEQLQHEGINVLTVLDAAYPKCLKQALG